MPLHLSFKSKVPLFFSHRIKCIILSAILGTTLILDRAMSDLTFSTKTLIQSLDEADLECPPMKGLNEPSR